jgi:hypothetical protein
MLQQALNVLGFACGATDGIFGAFSERAVREFQRNAGLPDDGIVGPDTARTITNLRHVWEGKDALSHSAAKASPARAAEVLARTDVAVGGRDASGLRIAERVVNLARATTDAAKIHLADSDESAAVSSFTLTLCDAGVVGAVPGRPHVRLDDADAFATRLVTAVAAARNGLSEVVIELPASTLPDEREDQRSAVLILDALCVAFD